MTEERAPLEGRRAMLVEDDLRPGGPVPRGAGKPGRCIVTGPAVTVAEARGAGDGGPAADVAVLDLKLGGALSWPVIERLSDRGVPLVIVSGYSGIFVTDGTPTPPILPKPIAPDFLVDADHRRTRGED
jgi:hypothetical protein